MFAFTPGHLPLLVSFPHAGTEIPPEIAARMTPEALQLADVDWHLPQLYAFVRAMGASTIAARFARHVIDLNLGTADGRACAPALQAAAEAAMAAQSAYTHVSNGRFKGGHITRHYGQPERGIHALQLEMCQSTYMDETAPFAYRADLAAQVQPLLQRMLDAVMDARAQRA